MYVVQYKSGPSVYWVLVKARNPKQAIALAKRWLRLRDKTILGASEADETYQVDGIPVLAG